MTQLTGSLEGVSLLQCMRLLSQLHATGCLKVSLDEWVGEIVFERGQVIAASVGSQSGRDALTTILLALSDGQFAFYDAPPSAQRDIDMGADELAVYLDTVATLGGVARRTPRSLAGAPGRAEPRGARASAVDLVLDQDRIAELLATRGRHGQLGSADDRELLQTKQAIARLMDQGLIRVDTASPDSAVLPRSIPSPANHTGPAASPGARPAPTPDRGAAPRQAMPASAFEARGTSGARAAAAPDACPMLGFPDRPTYHYLRPVRLHHCFAVPNPAGIPIQDQAEFCFSDQFPTCPRYAAAAGAPNSLDDASTLSSATARLEADQPSWAPVKRLGSGAPTADRPVKRPRESDRYSPEAPTALQPPTDGPAVGGPGLRPSRDLAAGRNPEAWVAAAGPAPPGPPRKPSTTEAQDAGPLPPPGAGRRSRPPELRWIALLILPIAVSILGIVGLSQLIYSDESSWQEMESQIASRATLVASEEAASTSGASQTEAWFPVAPSEQQAPATPSPVDVSARSESRLPAAATGSKESLGSAPAHRTILDEHFADNPRGWPSNPESTAWLADGSYRQVARQASQFVALGAPITERLRDVVVTARFRKVGGPSGGGYGVIVRDEGPGPRDGINQGGRYYVLEAGDRGEVGIWRRENDRWIDILPWTSSPAVRPGAEPNLLTVQAVGQRLTFLVNGAHVASVTDGALVEGGVGVFVGGDYNEVALDAFRVEAPD